MDKDIDGDDSLNVNIRRNRVSRRKQERNKNLKQCKLDPSQSTSGVQQQTKCEPSTSTSGAQCRHKPVVDGNNVTVKADVKKDAGGKDKKATQPPKPKSNNLTKPDEIVAYILKNSQCKVPNLCQLIEEKFQAADYRAVLDEELRGITYADTIRSLDVQMSVLPTIYQSHIVTVEPHAITNLSRDEPSTFSRKRRKASKKCLVNKGTSEKSTDAKSVNANANNDGKINHPPSKEREGSSEMRALGGVN